ncbi:MAG: hypothetical protein EBS38_02640 [Actinobacteria bacterium]|nr:hypothetical protein [Actinomycetota bacterium]
MRFDLDSYQTVQERIDLFRKKFPDGRFEIDLVHMTDQQVVMRASVFTMFDSDKPTCVDFAEERLGSSPVNKTSHVENCATSALGRAISQLGGEFSPTNKKPSREEMEKVLRHRDWLGEAAKIKDTDGLRMLWAEASAAKASEEILTGIKEYASNVGDNSDKRNGDSGSVHRGDGKGAAK